MVRLNYISHDMPKNLSVSTKLLNTTSPTNQFLNVTTITNINMIQH